MTETKTVTIRVVVIDDHDLLRDGVVATLSRFDDMEIVAGGRSGEEAIELVRQHAPDVVVMDLLMPGIGGVEAIRVVTAETQTRVLALTSFVDGDLVRQALAAGAVSYLLKNVDAEDLADAIRRTARGGSALAPEATTALTKPQTSDALAALTGRELEVAQLIALGRSNSDIAHEMALSIFTVKNHVSQILGKLKVRSRTQIAAIILREEQAPTRTI